MGQEGAFWGAAIPLYLDLGVAPHVLGKAVQSCPTLFDPVDYTVHGILQTSPLEWVAFPFSRGDLPNPGIEPRSPALEVDSYQLSHKGSPRKLEWIFPT